MELQLNGWVTALLMCIAGLIGCDGQSGNEAASFGTQPEAGPVSNPTAFVSSVNPPRVVSTSPANGETDVDSGLEAITVTFDRPMKPDSFAWSYENKEDFPDVEGTPAYDSQRTTNTLPVKLAPGRRYVIWLNTSEIKGFLSVDGEPSPPYKLVFTTRAAEGNEKSAIPAPNTGNSDIDAAQSVR